MRSTTLSPKNNQLTLPIFLEFVELRTKVASVFPMTVGILWSVYHYQQFNLLNTALFILAVLSFDMCTTAINNTIDYKKAVDRTYQKEDNVIGKHHLDYKQMVNIIFMLLIFASLISLILVYRTDVLLLPIGGICFLIGIFYTFGPFPLSRLPLGELFSGVTMGFGIFFLAIFVQHPNTLLSSHWAGTVMTIDWHWIETIIIFWLSLPLVCLIANIMLANNLCDFEQDLKNERQTLVYYIGEENALLLYTLLSIIPWVVWYLGIILGQIPLIGVAGVVIMPLYAKHLKTFRKEQIKRQTFVMSIKNFVLFSVMYLLTILIALIFPYL
ncbi:1,4-dihydroxy-2-naphthoate polyprenyltransferase [Streptococcus thoraltensis]|uniref:1,4-dihydroxy-2-naphthoate polyprenyltransferase n=1 Tax=Streptococcus thoraltensis TaxID=55085 RepID=UPI003BF4CAC7